MKKKFVAAILIVGLALSLMACGTRNEVSQKTEEPIVQEDTNEPEATDDSITEDYESDEMDGIEEGILGDYPSNEFETRVGQYSFDSYDEIIGLLEGKEAYAYIDLMGSDEKVLLVADETYEYGDDKIRMAICATPYIIDTKGTYRAGSIFYSDSLDCPIRLSDDDVVMVQSVQYPSVEGLVLGENGTETKGIMDLFFVAHYFAEDESEEDTYGGFIRDKATVVDNDGEKIDTTDPSVFNELLSDYEAASVIEFTVAGKEGADSSDISDIAGSYVKFSVEEYELEDGTYDAITCDERVIINDDKTGIASANDIIPIVNVTDDKIYYSEDDFDEYKLVDGVLIIIGDDYTDVYVKSNHDVSAQEADIEKMREEYCHPEAAEQTVVPGLYREACADEYEDGWVVWYSELNVADDMSATTVFQDVGPTFKSIQNGKAVSEDGTEYPCIVSHDCISIAIDENEPGLYTTFVRAE